MMAFTVKGGVLEDVNITPISSVRPTKKEMMKIYDNLSFLCTDVKAGAFPF